MKLGETTLAPTGLLQDGLANTRLGLGTWPMRDEEASTAVRNAQNMSYSLIGTAEAYENEEALGKGIHTSDVPREDIFITTKFNREWQSKDGVREACEASLRRLGVDYIDLLLIHW